MSLSCPSYRQINVEFDHIVLVLMCKGLEIIQMQGGAEVWAVPQSWQVVFRGGSYNWNAPPFPVCSTGLVGPRQWYWGEELVQYWLGEWSLISECPLFCWLSILLPLCKWHVFYLLILHLECRSVLPSTWFVVSLTELLLRLHPHFWKTGRQDVCSIQWG